jgi:hypothetical protein
METPGHVCDWLVKAIHSKALDVAGRCPSMSAFNGLRAALDREFGVRRTAVRPAALVADLLPEAWQKSGWKEFAKHQQLDRPPFRWLRSRLAREGTTVRDLVAQKLRRSGHAYLCSNGSIDRKAILGEVIRLTSEQMAIPVQRISENSHFIHDLEMG